MTLILLTGAGFSRNWGGWLGNEAFEYLLGRPEVSDELRERLWEDKLKGGGFEDTLAELQRQFRQYRDASVGQMLHDFMAALFAMFNEMNDGLKRTEFEFKVPGPGVRLFLSRFDYIFTLNQDLLLEYHYLDNAFFLSGGSKFNGSQILGTKLLNPNPHVQDRNQEKLAPRTPDLESLTTMARKQPYIKLHGSSNWVEEAKEPRLLVLGGGKSEEISQNPLLSFYQTVFSDVLHGSATKLMVIGYSFSDDHINKIIGHAAEQGALSLFIVDPIGVDILTKSKNSHRGVAAKQPLRDQPSPYIRGASRRLLSTTFGDDRVEHGKLMSFLGD